MEMGSANIQGTAGPPVPEIAAEVSRLHKNAEQLREGLRGHEEAIAAVLGPVPAVEPSSNVLPVDVGPQSSLAQELRAVNERLEGARRALAELTVRLEL